MLAAGPAWGNAIILNFTGLPSNTEHGTYNGFVTGTINHTEAFVDLICDDYSHTTYVPSGDLLYTAADIGSYRDARFGNQHEALEKYREAAIVVRAITDPTVLTALMHPAYSFTVGDLQYALWNLFTPHVGDTAHSQAILEYFADHPAPLSASYQNIYSGLVIYTPTARYSSNQEFLEVRTPAVPLDAPSPTGVPEPGTVATFGIGAALLGVGAYRRRAR
jgi:hypothetical protein